MKRKRILTALVTVAISLQMYPVPAVAETETAEEISVAMAEDIQIGEEDLCENADELFFDTGLYDENADLPEEVSPDGYSSDGYSSDGYSPNDLFEEESANEELPSDIIEDLSADIEFSNKTADELPADEEIPAELMDDFSSDEEFSAEITDDFSSDEEFPDEFMDNLSADENLPAGSTDGLYVPEINEELSSEITDELSAGQISLNASECTIYTFGSAFYEDYFKTMPENCPQTFQLKVLGTDKKPYIRIREGNAVDYDDDLVFSAPVGYSYTESAVYDVYVEGEKLTFTVHVKYYPEEYASQVMDQWIADNLDDSMTLEEKAEAIVRHTAEDYDYNGRYSSAASMIIAGGGDCWASTDMICEMCKKIGIEARWRSANIDAGAGSGHVNAAMKINGKYYIGEAGGSGKKPRWYEFCELDQDHLFVTRYLTEDTVSIIQYNGFEDEVTIPETIRGNTVTTIGYRCFSRSNNRDNLKTVHIPATVSKIDEEAFYYCDAMETITIPATVTEIDETAFMMTSAMKEFKVEAGNPSYKVMNKSLYTADGKTLAAVPLSWEGEYTVCNGCTRLGSHAFYQAGHITKVNLPSTLQVIGEEAFSFSSVQSADLPEGLTTIEDGAFSSNIRFDVTVPSSVKYVGKRALSTYKVRVLSMDAVYEEDALSGNVFLREGSTAQTFMDQKGRDYYLLDETGHVSLDSEWFTSSAWCEYNGKPQTNVWHNETEEAPYFLQENIDYTVSFENNINAGTAWIVWTGCGFYTGTVKQPFTIRPEYLYGPEHISIKCEDPTYRGTPVIPEITATDAEGRTMKEGTDYTIAITGNNAPGYMEITVTFCGNYEGSYEKYIYLANGMADLDNEGNETEEPDRPYDPNKPDKPDNSEPDPTGVGSDGSEADSRKDTSDDPDTDTAAENGDSIDADDPGTGTGKHGKNRQNGKNRDLSSKARAVAASKGKIVKVKGKKKTFSLRWKKVKNAAGYEIQYARNKKFTKKAVTVTASSKKKGIVIRKLKAKKKYYVRVRAYTIENGVRICGKWSKAKKVKTK